MISAEGPVDVEVVRDGVTPAVVWSALGVSAGRQETPEDAAATGCRWEPTITIDVPAEWSSGYYIVRVRAAGTLACASFAALPDLGAAVDVLLVLSTATWAAYNDWGGPNLYEGAHRVSFDRPWARGFLDRPEDPAGRQVAIAQSTDLDRDPDLLSGVTCFASVGHDEYWSWNMRDAVEGFVQRGGNALFLSGNTAFWQVRFEADHRQMVSYKYAAPWVDPLRDGPDRHLTTAMWSDPIVERPEQQLTGVSFTRGGYTRFGASTPGATGGYAVERSDHWVFGGTGLRYGDQLGAEVGVVGYEADGCDLSLSDGLLVPTGADGAPVDMTVLATAPAHLWSSTPAGSDLPPFVGQPLDVPGDLEYVSLRMLGDMSPEHTARFASGRAVLAIHEATDRGTTFTTGCTDWAHGLDPVVDPKVSRVTANLLDRLASAGRHRAPGSS